MSVANTPPIRTRAYPAGVPWLGERAQARVTLGNCFAAFSAEVYAACESRGIGCWVENPRSSWLWRQ
eukprot:3046574-Lingulodinium_polyedra.AAC.1